MEFLVLEPPEPQQDGRPTAREFSEVHALSKGEGVLGARAA